MPERVLSCCDCIHCDVCAGIGSCSYRYSDANKCRYFKNKADVAPVIHSSWEIVKTGDDIFDYCFRCNHCHKNTPSNSFVVSPEYCHYCGAKMDEEGVNNDV